MDMSTLEDRLKSSLVAALSPVLSLTLTSTSASCTSGAKVTIQIASPVFNDVKLLNRHKLVNAVFEPYLKTGEVHAVTIKALDEKQFGELEEPKSDA